jgi:TetR/AcrR family transcriptional regulator, copper-responsive repressor
MLRGWARARFEKTSTLRSGAEKGELPASADPEVLAQLASATIQTIAIRARARARVPRKQLEAIVKGSIEVMLRA